jgi:hypothetical protein
MNVRSETVAFFAVLVPVLVELVAPYEPAWAAAPSEHRPAMATPSPKLRSVPLETIFFSSSFLIFRCSGGGRVWSKPGKIEFRPE